MTTVKQQPVPFEGSGVFIDFGFGTSRRELPKKVAVSVAVNPNAPFAGGFDSFRQELDAFYERCADLPLAPLVVGGNTGDAAFYYVASSTSVGGPLVSGLCEYDAFATSFDVARYLAACEAHIRKALSYVPHELWDTSWGDRKIMERAGIADSLDTALAVCRMMKAINDHISRTSKTRTTEFSDHLIATRVAPVALPKQFSVRVIAASPRAHDLTTQAFYRKIDQFYANCSDLPVRELEMVVAEHYGLALVSSEGGDGAPVFVLSLCDDASAVDDTTMSVAGWEHELRQKMKDIPQDLWDFTEAPAARLFPAHTQAQANTCVGAEVQLSATSPLMNEAPASTFACTGMITASACVVGGEHLVMTTIRGLTGRWLAASNFDLLVWPADELAPQTKYTCLPLEPVVAERDAELLSAFERAQLRDIITADQADGMRRTLRRRTMSNEQVAEARGIDLLKLNQLIASTLSTGKVDELQSMTAINGDPLLEATHQHKKGGLYQYVGTIDFKLTFGEQTFISKQAVFWHLWPFAKELRQRPAEEFNDPSRFRPLQDFAPE
jgi:hypothetical protein